MAELNCPFTFYSLLLSSLDIFIRYHFFYPNISGILMAALHTCYAMFVQWGNNCQNKQIFILVCQIIWEANIHLGTSHWVQTETSCLVEKYACIVIEISNTSLRQFLSVLMTSEFSFFFNISASWHFHMVWKLKVQ